MAFGCVCLKCPVSSVDVRVLVRRLLVVVPVGVVGNSGRADHVGVTTVFVPGVQLEAGFLVMIALEDLLQRQNTGDSERNLADDQSLEGDGTEGLQTNRASNADGGEHGSDDVSAAVLLVTAASCFSQIHLDGVCLEEAVQLLDEGTVRTAQAFQGAGVRQSGDGFVLGIIGDVLLD